jgi:hypothetical protein
VQLQQTTRIAKQRFAIRRELYAATLALEQRPVQRRFQSPHLHGDGGLSAMHLLRGGGEATRIDNGDKGAQEIRVELDGHKNAPYSSQKMMSHIKLIRWMNQ